MWNKTVTSRLLTLLAEIATRRAAMIEPTFQFCITQTDFSKFSVIETHLYFICFKYTIKG
jgi:hypothetical protein